MINRRLFLQCAAAMFVLPKLPQAESIKQLDLWEAKIKTILQMASDYGFSDLQTKGLFGYPAWNTWSRVELHNQLLEPFARDSLDMQVRVNDVLTVHTWVRGKCGSCVQAQLIELDKPQASLYCPHKLADGNLGSLLHLAGDYFNLRQAAKFCQEHSHV